LLSEREIFATGQRWSYIVFSSFERSIMSETKKPRRVTGKGKIKKSASNLNPVTRKIKADSYLRSIVEHQTTRDFWFMFYYSMFRINTKTPSRKLKLEFDKKKFVEIDYQDSAPTPEDRKLLYLSFAVERPTDLQFDKDKYTIAVSGEMLCKHLTKAGKYDRRYIARFKERYKKFMKTIITTNMVFDDESDFVMFPILRKVHWNSKHRMFHLTLDVVMPEKIMSAPLKPILELNSELAITLFYALYGRMHGNKRSDMELNFDTIAEICGLEHWYGKYLKQEIGRYLIPALDELQDKNYYSWKMIESKTDENKIKFQFERLRAFNEFSREQLKE